MENGKYVQGMSVMHRLGTAHIYFVGEGDDNGARGCERQTVRYSCRLEWMSIRYSGLVN